LATQVILGKVTFGLTLNGECVMEGSSRGSRLRYLDATKLALEDQNAVSELEIVLLEAEVAREKARQKVLEAQVAFQIAEGKALDAERALLQLERDLVRQYGQSAR
jgi:hypothetical protein